MKEEILNLLTMQDILSKYGIKTERNGMFHCPFHGEDKNASAKAYKTSYYCFCCNSTHDLIGFVQEYFNLTFVQAMNKIVEDFGLPIKTTGNYDKNKILEFQKQRELEKQKKEEKRLYFIKLCDRKDLYNKIARDIKEKINEKNWEELTYVISFLENRANLLEIYICDKYNIQN